jgi:hypothetical protein
MAAGVMSNSLVRVGTPIGAAATPAQRPRSATVTKTAVTYSDSANGHESSQGKIGTRQSGTIGIQSRKKKARPFQVGLFDLTGRLPSLPHTRACSTIGAEGLNFRVRDGNGWDPLAKVTQKALSEPLTTSAKLRGLCAHDPERYLRVFG